MRQIELSVKFEPRDLWIGVYWNKEKDVIDWDRLATGQVPSRYNVLDIYICVLPCLLIKYSNKQFFSVKH